ncbi:MAG TPA: hypothetical protein VF677_09985 [Flavobacterium sp.]|jgi:hypothetical protein
MNKTVNIEERKPIWIELSQLYLDIELQETDFRYIAFKIIESPYSLDEVKEINKFEVFPVLYTNLLSVAGEWAGFNENWLVNTITGSLAKRNTIKKIGIKILFFTFKWMQTSYWEKLEKIYNELVANPDPLL